MKLGGVAALASALVLVDAPIVQAHPGDVTIEALAATAGARRRPRKPRKRRRVEPRPRMFALGVTTLKELGFGATVRLRFDHFGLEASGGGMPWFVFVSGSCNAITGGFAPHATLSALAWFTGDQSRFQPGIRVAGMWDGQFGWGGQIGFNADFTLSDLLALNIGVGLQGYPEGESRGRAIVAEECSVSPDAVQTGDLAELIVQPQIGLNLMFYLF